MGRELQFHFRTPLRTLSADLSCREASSLLWKASTDAAPKGDMHRPSPPEVACTGPKGPPPPLRGRCPPGHASGSLRPASPAPAPAPGSHPAPGSLGSASPRQRPTPGQLRCHRPRSASGSPPASSNVVTPPGRHPPPAPAAPPPMLSRTTPQAPPTPSPMLSRTTPSPSRPDRHPPMLSRTTIQAPPLPFQCCHGQPLRLRRDPSNVVTKTSAS